MPYTERFSEGAAILGHIHPASYNQETNTGYVDSANYHRIAIIINSGVLGGDLDVDIEEGTDTAGTGAQAFDSNGKDITIHNADDNTLNIIEIHSDEFDVADGYHCLNVETTPGGASIYDVLVIGFEPRFLPVPTTALDSVTD